MPYRFDTREDSRQGIRRCAREQLDRAVDELTDQVRDDPVEAVHAARKALKKERSLLRLCRGTLDPAERRRENEAVREAGRRLSGPRDAEVMIQALDDLADRFAGQAPKRTFNAVRRQLEAERDPARARLLESRLTADVADQLRAVRSRSEEWRISREGWPAVKSGLDRSYRRGRDALDRVRSQPTVENLHDWRKRTKDLWYHLRLLAPAAPAILGGQAKEAHRLSDLLGDDHDLAVLRERLETAADELAVDLDPVLGLIGHRREQLQEQAVLAGERLYAEKPKAFRRRLHRYWQAGRAEARTAGASRPTAPALG